jgi:ubiquinone biosynthesis protein
MKAFIKGIINHRSRKSIRLFLSLYLQYWWLNITKIFYSKNDLGTKYQQLYSLQGKRFVAHANELGGLIVKLGQYLRTRVDFLPKEYLRELANLQEEVVPIDSKELNKEIEAQFPGPLQEFISEFCDRPMQITSLWQIHEAKLTDGQLVAVKVKRPEISALIAADTISIKILLSLANRVTEIRYKLPLEDIYDEFIETVFNELDFQLAVENSEEFRENFAEDNQIYHPKIFENLTTANLVTMELVKGIPINQYQKLDRRGLNRRELAEKLLSSFLMQTLVDGLVNTNIHPDFILVNPQGKLVLLNFGLGQRLAPDLKDTMVTLLMSLGRNGPKLATLPLKLPERSYFLRQSLIKITELCYGLDPEFDFMKVAGPFIRHMFSGEESRDVGEEVLIID